MLVKMIKWILCPLLVHSGSNDCNQDGFYQLELLRELYNKYMGDHKSLYVSELKDIPDYKISLLSVAIVQFSNNNQGFIFVK